MCCCYVHKCCCGCITIKMGAYTMAIFDLFMNCVICMFFGVIIGIYGYNLSTIWLFSIFLLIWGNLLLLCGLNGDGCGFMIATWQVIMFIYICLQIICLILILGLIPLILDNHLLMDISDMLNTPINIDFLSMDYLQWGAVMLVMLLLPVYYIYFWIIVNSYRKSLNRRRRRTNRLEAAKNQNLNLVHNQPVYFSPYYRNEAYDYHTQYTDNLYDEYPTSFTQDSSNNTQSLPQRTVYNNAHEMSDIQE